MNCRFIPADFVESNDVLTNPYCGFYALLPYSLDETRSEKDEGWWISTYIDHEASSLILLEVNLCRYSATA